MRNSALVSARLTPEAIPVALPRRLEERRQVLRRSLQFSDQLAPNCLRALPNRVLIGALVVRNPPRQQSPTVRLRNRGRPHRYHTATGRGQSIFLRYPARRSR